MLPAGKHDNRHPGGKGILLEKSTYLIAFDFGHLDIQDYEIGQEGKSLYGRLDAVPGHVHLVTGMLQDRPGHLDNELIVIGQKYVSFSAHDFLSSRHGFTRLHYRLIAARG